MKHEIELLAYKFHGKIIQNDDKDNFVKQLKLIPKDKLDHVMTELLFNEWYLQDDYEYIFNLITSYKEVIHNEI